MKKKLSLEELPDLQAQYFRVQSQVVVLRRLLKEQRELLIDLGQKCAEFGLRRNSRCFSSKKYQNVKMNKIDSYTF